MRDVGKIFSDARERAALSLDEAASRLCLRSQQVEALEQGAVDALPGPTFVRGFIRSYAKLLHLDAEPLVEAHRRHAPAGGTGQISLKSEHIPIIEPSRHNWLPYVQAAAVIGMALGAWMVYMDYFAGRPAETPAAQQESAAETQPLPPLEAAEVEIAIPQPPMTDTAVAPVAVPPPEAAAAADPLAQPAAAQPGAAPAASPVAGAKLKLAFAESSWVRVRDRDGRDLLNKTASAGSVEEISGTPPFRVEIGNTAGARLSYNEQAVDLAPYTRANVARFTLE